MTGGNARNQYCKITALYSRLSVGDEDRGSGDIDREIEVTNQRYSILRQEQWQQQPRKMQETEL